VCTLDGVTEARDNADNLFTEARLEACLHWATCLCADALIRVAVEAVDAFVGEAPQADDLTVLVLRYLGPPARVQE
jgi:sigma-B regulation protein RsbU (phosphoserine phosphatase)